MALVLHFRMITIAVKSEYRGVKNERRETTLEAAAKWR